MGACQSAYASRSLCPLKQSPASGCDANQKAPPSARGTIAKRRPRARVSNGLGGAPAPLGARAQSESPSTDASTPECTPNPMSVASCELDANARRRTALRAPSAPTTAAPSTREPSSKLSATPSDATLAATRLMPRRTASLGRPSASAASRCDSRRLHTCCKFSGVSDDALSHVPLCERYAAAGIRTVFDASSRRPPRPRERSATWERPHMPRPRSARSVCESKTWKGTPRRNRDLASASPAGPAPTINIGRMDSTPRPVNPISFES